MGEIGLPRLARSVLLWEKDLMTLVFSIEGPPLCNMPVQRPYLTRG